MSATDPQGAQKFWHQYDGSFETVARTGVDPGSQKWWLASMYTFGEEVLSLDGLIGSAPPPAVSTFPALTVAP